ncbi:MAG: adhesin [Methanobacteriaceae archaeon]
MVKKLGKGILKQITIVDILIILVIIGAIAFAFINTGQNEDKVQTESFDASTMNKFVEKYLDKYKEGKIISTTVTGYNSSSGNVEEFKGRIVWVDDESGTDVKVLIDVKGSLVLVGLYKDSRNADIYLNHITLETNGSKYSNITEITIAPMNVTNINDLIANLPKDMTYEITGTISIKKQDSTIHQSVLNTLMENGKRISIKVDEYNNDQLKLIQAQKKEIELASSIFGNINGKTGIIKLRIYNATSEDINIIKTNYDVKDIVKIT